MKQVNFSHSGGFPLEQETLERLQTAYRSELYEAIKRHLSIEPDTNYILAPATADSKGWAVIHQYEADASGETTLQGILYPITNYPVTGFLRTTRTETNLIYGTGESQTAYLDYEATYISESDFNNKMPGDEEDEKVRTYYFYNLSGFSKVKDIKAIEQILASIDSQITTIKGDINTINQTYLPLNGSKAMQGDLSLGTHHLYLNNLNAATSNDYLLAVNNQNQVVKNNTLLQSLVNRIETLESRPTTSIPIGMVAIWGKPAPFPEGWEEYIPLQGRMPIGFTHNDDEFNTLGEFGGTKSSVGLVPIPSTGYTYSQNTSKGTAGKLVISTGKEELGENLESVAIVSTTPTISVAVNNLNPYRVVHFIEYTGQSTNPTTPTNPTDSLTVSNLSLRSLTLNWTALNSQFEPTHYSVFKDGVLIASLGNVRSYNVTGLTPGASYSFHIVAKDATDTLSFISVTVNATTLIDNIPPTAPTLVVAALQGETRIIVNWNSGTDNEEITGYEVWRKESIGDYELITTTSEQSFIDLTVSKYNTYYYRVKAIDTVGNSSEFSPEAEVKANPDILDE